MNISALIVTYGNRYSYLSTVLDRLEELSLFKIIIVLNGVEQIAKDNILKRAKDNPLYKIVDKGVNTGSSGGFYYGIKEAVTNQKSQFIWLLDDDNLPQKNALNWLIKKVNNTSFDIFKDALLSFRPDRPKYLHAKKSNNGSAMLKGKNSSLGFSLFKNYQFSNYEMEGLKVAPYSGFFFHKNLISHIGFPDLSYYLYGDDFDFSIRVTKNGGKIWLEEKSVITDLEKSFHLKKEKKRLTRFHKTNNLDLIFYSTRNNIVFEIKYMVTSKVIYIINLIVYSILINILLFITLDFLKMNKFTNGVFQGVKKGLK